MSTTTATIESATIGTSTELPSAELPSAPHRLSWEPTAAELQAILAEMRPVIDHLVERDRLLLDEWAKAA